MDMDKAQQSSSSINIHEVPVTSTGNNINDFSKRKAKQHNTSKRELAENSELSLYLQTETENIETDPLLFWEKNKYTFPKLYKVCVLLSSSIQPRYTIFL